MSAREQNRRNLKGLAAAAGRQQSNSNATLAVASSELPSTQPGSSATAQIGEIAHDFNNILTLVLGYGEKLLKMLPKDHPGHSFAEEIYRAAKEGERLSMELSSLAQSGHHGRSDGPAR